MLQLEVSSKGESLDLQERRHPNVLQRFPFLIPFVLVTVGLIVALVILIPRAMHDCDSETTAVASGDLKFSCNVQCVKNAARLQGADVLTSLDNLKYQISVTLNAGEDSGEACGINHTFPEVHVTIDPSVPTKISTAETRTTPTVIFECHPSKYYHLLLNDALGGAFQNHTAYNHWLKVNIECNSSGFTEATKSGTDIRQGSPAVPGWFSGYGYLYPAFGFNTFHHFNFYIFETDDPFSNDRVQQINDEFPGRNMLQNPTRPADTATEIMAWLGLGNPVARTWMDVTTSYWSPVRMGRLVPYVPALVNQTFYKVLCPCNLPSNAQGTGSLLSTTACNI